MYYRNLIVLLFVFFLLFSCNQIPDKQIKTEKSGNKEVITGIDRAFVSFRIGVPLWMPEDRFAGLLDLFDKYRGVTDEITFFTSATHAPLPPDVFSNRIEILKDRMEAVRKRGYRTGINILTTIGHHNEDLDNSLKGDYTYMTNIDGEVCHGSFCPNDENMREYIRELYRITTHANPDYIWIDDDVRLGHMPIGYGCFCDNCLKIFENETGKRYTRESLKQAFNEGQTEEKLKIRKEWLSHNRNTISRLFLLIKETVHTINPSMPLGFMTGDRFFEGYDFDNWADILAGYDNTTVMWRPGGGYYNDNNNNDLIGKSHDIGRQVSLLPEYVISVQSEIENFPYQRLKKAENIVVLEAASHMAAGCTGAAFNVLSMYNEPLDEYEPLMARLLQARPFFDLMAKSLGRSSITGIFNYWNKDVFAAGRLSEGNWIGGGPPLAGYEIYNIGLPVCYADGGARVTVLNQDNVLTIPRDEIKKILSGSVYMDAGALQQLNELGFGEFTGFEAVQAEYKDRIEKFTDHPLNDEFAGRERDNRQSFWNEPAYTLQKTSDAAQILAGLIDYQGNIVSEITMGIFENNYGGRICVAGYYPWTFLENLSKSSQMKSVFRWLSKDKLPGYIASFHRINLWIREPQDGIVALAFTNASFDPVKNVVLMLNTENNKIRIYDMDCKATVIRSSGEDGPYEKFVIPYIDPWQMRFVVVD